MLVVVRRLFLPGVVSVLVAVPVHAGLEDRPLPPTALVAMTGEEGHVLSWIPPALGAAVESYNVYRVNGTAHELLATVAPDQTTYTDASAARDYVYTYYVTSQASNGESPPSNPSMAGYPHCYYVVKPDGQLASECYLPPPGGGQLIDWSIVRT